MTSISDLEHRVQLAQEAVEAAYQAGNETSARLHSFRLQKAEEALTAARVEEEATRPPRISSQAGLASIRGGLGL